MRVFSYFWLIFYCFDFCYCCKAIETKFGGGEVSDATAYMLIYRSPALLGPVCPKREAPAELKATVLSDNNQVRKEKIEVTEKMKQRRIKVFRTVPDKDESRLFDLFQSDTLESLMQRSLTSFNIEPTVASPEIRLKELKQGKERVLEPLSSTLFELEIETLTAVQLEQKVDGLWPGESSESAIQVACVEYKSISPDGPGPDPGGVWVPRDDIVLHDLHSAGMDYARLLAQVSRSFPWKESEASRTVLCSAMVDETSGRVISGEVLCEFKSSPYLLNLCFHWRP